MLATAQRLNGFTESVIRETIRDARLHGAINLAQGFPDFDLSAELLAAAHEMTGGDHLQHAITWGAPAFRRAG